ncbi:hypothetical protein SAMN05216553_118163 [Lentzea fradiae]|uniref:Uncharacterized protein n=2 Tax=Lentzea fradiae TaxID=200378 RepID=A0A1G8AYK1_9PSEU|nr:hypothetical protein SAMN05216553_118163 [Lentzea fradiae]
MLAGAQSLEEILKLEFLGTTSNSGSCPTLFLTDRGTYVVQGYRVTDPEAIATAEAREGGLPDTETLIEIPVELLKFAPQGV